MKHFRSLRRCGSAVQVVWGLAMLAGMAWPRHLAAGPPLIRVITPAPIEQRTPSSTPQSQAVSQLRATPAGVPKPDHSATPTRGGNHSRSRLRYINTSFENASPLYWETAGDGTIQIFLVYDQERGSPNRANGHWHFQLQAEPGARLTLVLNNLNNIWNGHPGIPVSDRTVCRVSEDGAHWRVVPTEIVNGEQLRFDVELPTGQLYVAHLEPYRIGDLDRLIAEIRPHPLVRIIPIGQTVQGRTLSIIRVGHPEAPHRVLLRARAHAWESGGNWVVQGLIRSLLREEPANQQYLERYAVYILPMANMDGVAQGRTRFNLLGVDLNRKWDRPADPTYSPENHALESWLEQMIAQDRKPDLAIDLHNDQSGKLHISRPHIQLESYLEKMDRYAALLRKYTWFTEGRTGGGFHNPGSFGEGLLERYDITAFVQELNANWIAGLNDDASGRNWELLGEQYRKVFYHYFGGENGNGPERPLNDATGSRGTP